MLTLRSPAMISLEVNEGPSEYKRFERVSISVMDEGGR